MSKLNTLQFVGDGQVADVGCVKGFGNSPRVMPFDAPTLNAACLGVECGRRKRKKQCDSHRTTLELRGESLNGAVILDSIALPLGHHSCDLDLPIDLISPCNLALCHAYPEKHKMPKLDFIKGGAEQSVGRAVHQTVGLPS